LRAGRKRGLESLLRAERCFNIRIVVRGDSYQHRVIGGMAWRRQIFGIKDEQSTKKNEEHTKNDEPRIQNTTLREVLYSASKRLL
jgi:hypothetical protein